MNVQELNDFVKKNQYNFHPCGCDECGSIDDLLQWQTVILCLDCFEDAKEVSRDPR